MRNSSKNVLVLLTLILLYRHKEIFVTLYQRMNIVLTIIRLLFKQK